MGTVRAARRSFVSTNVSSHTSMSVPDPPPPSGPKPVMLKLGEIMNFGGKLYACCPRCAKIVRVNKPFIGDMHVCA